VEEGKDGRKKGGREEGESASFSSNLPSFHPPSSKSLQKINFNAEICLGGEKNTHAN
jgi:hypothetical protein